MNPLQKIKNLFGPPPKKATFPDKCNFCFSERRPDLKFITSTMNNSAFICAVCLVKATKVLDKKGKSNKEMRV